MATLIKQAPEYTSYDTTSANQSATLTAVTGKEYEVRNSGTGGNTLTVTYGSSSIILNDGESGRLTYDGSGWSAQFSNATIGGRYLTSGRKDSDELKVTSFTVSSTNWYRVAQIDGSANRSPAGCIGLAIRDSATTGMSTQFVEFGHYNTGVGGVERYCRTRPINGSSGFILGWRLAYGSSVGDDAYIEVLLKDTTYSEGILKLTDNIDAPTTGYKGAELMQPVLAGVSDNYLVAGSEVSLFTNNATYFIPNMCAMKSTDDTMRVSIDVDEILYPKVLTVTLTEPTSFYFVEDYTNTSVNLVGVAYTITNIGVEKNKLRFYINSSGLFTSFAGNAKSSIRIGGTGKFTLS